MTDDADWQRQDAQANYSLAISEMRKARQRERVTVLHGDCREVLKTLPDASVDACVTDPPYALNFMGKKWDVGAVAFDPDTWREVLRVLKPGGHCLAFGGTRTFHRLVCAIEDAGFEIRDSIAWLYGSGFPKSHNVSVAIDRASGPPPRAKAFNMKGRGSRVEELDANGRTFLPPYEPATDAARQWAGWGTALKPSLELICVARKPLIGTVAANVLKYGTGALNIDACRIKTGDDLNGGAYAEVGGRNVSPSLHHGSGMNVPGKTTGREYRQPEGRWPANTAHDGSAEVLAGFPQTQSSEPRAPTGSRQRQSGFHMTDGSGGLGDSGSAARFFYTSKADASDRLGSRHPTVKPVDLMAWLCRLVCPPGGVVLDPFAGSGTTGMACLREGFRAILIEREAQYVEDIRRRVAHVAGEDAPLFAGQTDG